MGSPEFLTTDQMCKLLKINKAQLYNWTHLRRIPHFKIGRHLRFRRDQIERWLNDRYKPIQ